VTLAGWAELVATMLIVLTVIDFAWTALAAQARKALRSPRAVQAANRVSATVMVGAAAAIASR
jgi:threonine/homoserine/homoserine lactone efflux protein